MKQVCLKGEKNGLIHVVRSCAIGRHDRSCIRKMAESLYTVYFLDEWWFCGPFVAIAFVYSFIPRY